MRKFLVIAKAFWQRSLAYRFTVLSYRAGEVAELFVLILMWSAIYEGQEVIRGFTFPEMVTYMLIGNFFNVMVRNFLSEVVARDIKDGRLSMFLVRPLGYFYWMVAREVGRISLSTLLSMLSQGIVILFFLHIFIWNLNPVHVLVIISMLILAFITELLLSYLVGLVAFWTEEVDGLYRSVDRIKRFFAGGYFPLSLLPAAFIQASFLLPFAYTFYIPAQLYLHKIDIMTGIFGLGIQAVWIVLLYAGIRVVWNRGLRKYEGVGI